MTLKTEANVLLLDEPTNDIDVNTLRALEEGIENLRAVPWSFPTTVGSWTVYAHTSSHSKETHKYIGSKEATQNTKKTVANASVTPDQNASVTAA